MTIRSHTHVSALPDELLLNIFAFLDAEDILYGVTLVCKRWHSLSKDNLLWKSLFEAQYGTLVAPRRSRRRHLRRSTADLHQPPEPSQFSVNPLRKIRQLFTLLQRSSKSTPKEEEEAQREEEEETEEEISWYDLFKHAVAVNLRLCHAWSGLASVPPPTVACIWDTTTESELVSLFQSAFNGTSAPLIDTDSNAQHISLCCVRTGQTPPVSPRGATTTPTTAAGLPLLPLSTSYSSSRRSSTGGSGSGSSSSTNGVNPLSRSDPSSASSSSSSSSSGNGANGGTRLTPRRLCKCSSSESLCSNSFVALDPAAALSSETVQLGSNGKRSASTLGITTGDTIEMLVLHS